MQQEQIAITRTTELIVDNFAGGGGASLGIEWAFGRPPDIAVNHDREAVAMRAANHPATEHYCEDVWKVDPVKACKGRPVGLAWFSPDCKHFSKAKGGKPVSKKIRGLAWIVVKWAKKVRPRVIMLENVEEFEDWGPLTFAMDPDGAYQLDRDGRPKLIPCPKRKGQTFLHWKAELERLGYKVDWRPLRACDYGAPTIRKRLFLIARCDGRPIVWPKPTHGDPQSLAVKRGKLKPWRTAAECVDWSIPVTSIFERERPLAENTLRRIARGIRRYVIEAAEPFIINTRNGERASQAPRTRGIREPFWTVTAQGSQHALVSAFLAKHYGGNYDGPGASLAAPASTVTTVDHHALVASHLVKLRGTCRDGQANTEPMPTVTAGGLHIGEVRAFLVKYYGTDQDPQMTEPMHTVTTKHRFGLVTVRGEEYVIADIGMRMLEPRELFRAQGFSDGYIIAPEVNGKPLSKAAQVRMCGNSVVPHLAKALVEANVVGRSGKTRVAA